MTHPKYECWQVSWYQENVFVRMNFPTEEQARRHMDFLLHDTYSPARTQVQDVQIEPMLEWPKEYRRTDLTEVLNKAVASFLSGAKELKI